MSLQVPGMKGGEIREREHVPPADIDLVAQGQGDRLAGGSLLKIAVHGDNPRHAAGAPRRGDPHLVTGTDGAGGDGAAEAAEIQVGAIHPLHRQAERFFPAIILDLHRLQMVHQGRPVVPRGVGAGVDDVIPAEGGDGDGRNGGKAEWDGELLVVAADRLELLLVEIDQVHLVDRQDDMADADQGDQVAVSPRLGEEPLAGIDQDDRHLGGGCAGDHVAGILLVARGVGDDELALVGGEVAVGHVDGDPLLPLRLQAVQEEGIVDGSPLGADPLAVRLQGRQLILEHHLRIPEKTADEGTLAVIHAAAGDEAQQRLLFLALQVGEDILFYQVRLMCHVIPPESG